MDQGIISWLKTKYRYSLVHDLLEIYSDEGKRTNAVQSRKGGIRQGLRPDLYDAIIKVDKVWEEASEEIIIKCYRKKSFGDSDKVIELLARMKQLMLAYDNTLTELNGYRGHIKRAKMKQGRISSFFHPKVN